MHFPAIRRHLQKYLNVLKTLQQTALPFDFGGIVTDRIEVTL